MVNNLEIVTKDKYSPHSLPAASDKGTEAEEARGHAMGAAGRGALRLATTMVAEIEGLLESEKLEAGTSYGTIINVAYWNLFRFVVSRITPKERAEFAKLAGLSDTLAEAILAHCSE